MIALGNRCYYNKKEPLDQVVPKTSVPERILSPWGAEGRTAFKSKEGGVEKAYPRQRKTRIAGV